MEIVIVCVRMMGWGIKEEKMQELKDLSNLIKNESNGSGKVKFLQYFDTANSWTALVKRSACEQHQCAWVGAYSILRDEYRLSFLTLGPTQPLLEANTTSVSLSLYVNIIFEVLLYVRLKYVRWMKQDVFPYRKSTGARVSPPKAGISRISSGPVTAVQSRWSSAARLTRVTLHSEG